jgi:hypothetical protein
MTSTTSTRGLTARVSAPAAYGGQVSAVLAVAFALSAAHTVYGYVTGIGDPGFTVTTPSAWAFYLVGFASAVLARKEVPWVRIVLPVYLGLLVLVAVFFYPTTFKTSQQTTFGWFENDVYTGLLMIALYLSVQRLRAPRLAPGPTRHWIHR